MDPLLNIWDTINLFSKQQAVSGNCKSSKSVTIQQKSPY